MSNLKLSDKELETMLAVTSELRKMPYEKLSAWYMEKEGIKPSSEWDG